MYQISTKALLIAIFVLGLTTSCAGPHSSSASTSAPQVAAPNFSPAAGTYTTAQTVTLSNGTSGATIYYTTDGSTPTTSSAQYTAPIAVPTTRTISAMATLVGNTNSFTASALYTISIPPAATPVFNPSAATYSSPQSVTISDTTAGATIYYTLDGSTPTASSTKYTAPITVSASETITAIAVASGLATSSATGAFVISTPGSFITVNPTNLGAAVTNQIMGMNMAIWYDPTTSAILPAFQAAGITAVRWPGGSDSDSYHWQTNSLCGTNTYVGPNTSFTQFARYLTLAGNLDLAITANYGSNAACNAGGDPTEAAAWVTDALNLGINVSHWTVGNEEFGYWEEDLHPVKNDPTTYANAVATGYYPLMKAANPNTLVGVDVDGGFTPTWDSIVLSQAKYDFVEYHFYPQIAGHENDTFLVHQAAPQITTAINLIKTELSAAGHPNTPIYVGEIGSVNTDDGKQGTSITQALFAGQVLGEMMNAGISRATWWIGFGGCTYSGTGNFSSSLYGWQNFGGYMVFSDGLPESNCPNASKVPVGTLLPTARAYQLFSNVAVNGEHALQATVSGNTTDVRAYSATKSGGTILVLFNLNQTQTQTVSVSVSGQIESSTVTIETYDKAIYDQSQNNVWASPNTISIGAQHLPLTLSLTPWSMNVVTIPQ